MTLDQDLEHYVTIISGCESVQDNFNHGLKLDYNGQYAMSVLKLHAQDAGHVAGTEGFLDAVKRGATNIYEWIKKLIETIRGWFRTSTVEKDVAKMEEVAKAVEKPEPPKEMVRRMGVLKLLLKLKRDRFGGVAGNERIGIDAIAEEVEKMSPEQLKQVEIYLAAITDDPDYKEAVKEDHDFVINKAIAALKPRVTELNDLLEQMKEADPDGNAAKALGIDPSRAFSQFGDILTKIDHVSSGTLTAITSSIGRGVVDANKLLKSATDKLDALNNANKTNGGPVVSQAARIVKLLGTFVEVGRKLVAQLTVIMEKGEYNALSVFISRRWFEARTQFAAIK